MEEFEVELCYAWQETEEGIYHAFETLDTEAHVDFDAVAEKLASLLDTTIDDEQFNWDSMRVSLPAAVAERIAATRICDGIEKAANGVPAVRDTVTTIQVWPNPSCPSFEMTIKAPGDRDAEEYINELLDGILNEDVRYNCEWEFV